MRKVVNAFEVDSIPVESLTYSQKRKALKEYGKDFLKDMANAGIDLLINEDNEYMMFSEFMAIRDTKMVEIMDKHNLVIGHYGTSYFSWEELWITGYGDRYIVMECYESNQ